MYVHKDIVRWYYITSENSSSSNMSAIQPRQMPYTVQLQSCVPCKAVDNTTEPLFKHVAIS